MKVIERIQEAWEQDRISISFEFMPPRTEKGMKLLHASLERVAVYQPTFCDITWRASSSQMSLDIAKTMKNKFGLETMMHLTCIGSTTEIVDNALEFVKENNVENILALRGDPPEGNEEVPEGDSELQCALDLVRHIRKKFGSYFGIVVAGYPEAHPDLIGNDGAATKENYMKDLQYLKQKVDAGADLIISQLFYDTDLFLKFVDDCREIGITCPVIPGILPIHDHRKFLRMTSLCKTKIPAEVTAKLAEIKDNPEAVKNYGIHLGTQMCRTILDHGVKGLHLYTLNAEKTALTILQNLGLIEVQDVARPLSVPSREKEEEVHTVKRKAPLLSSPAATENGNLVFALAS